MPAERLQKIMAAAGIASRRKAEELITAGRVTVNGQTVTELGSKADAASDDIRVDGKPLHSEQPVYVLLHKPKGYVTTVSDPEGRPTVMDLLKGVPQRIFPVGRLDYLSEGLLLLTNDGELAAKLTHASTHVAKRYLVKVSGQPEESDIQRLREGVVLPPEHGHVHAPAEEGGRFAGQKRRSTAVSTAPATISLIRSGDNPWYEVTLVEGRNRQIRRMFSLIGHHVEKIRRVAYGPLELDVDIGQFRALTSAEVSRLRNAASGQPQPERAASARVMPKQARPFRSQPRDREREQRSRFSKPPRRDAGRSERPAFGRREQGERYSAREDRQGRNDRPGKPRRDFAESRTGRPPFEQRQRTDRPYDRPRDRNRPDDRPSKPRREFAESRPPFEQRQRTDRPYDRPRDHNTSDNRPGKPRRDFGEGRREQSPGGGGERSRPFEKNKFGRDKKGGNPRREFSKGPRPFKGRNEEARGGQESGSRRGPSGSRQGERAGFAGKRGPGGRPSGNRPFGRKKSPPRFRKPNQ